MLNYKDPISETSFYRPDLSIKICENETKKNKKKQYDCDQCFKSFNRPSALKTHTYTHTGEKPYICSSHGCNRRFSVVSNLRRHLRVHKKPENTTKAPKEAQEHSTKIHEKKRELKESVSDCLNEPFFTYNEYGIMCCNGLLAARLSSIQNMDTSYEIVSRDLMYPMESFGVYESLLMEQAPFVRSEVYSLEKEFGCIPIFYS